uniref:Ribonuclease H-like domain-containing protein n=1 Tax=Tanacetum cinerariifolium TaxID=118510 RepID=A0A6L2KG22_TANCI|nr:ribonuclease H-like domain-containing protein [Tanacetum cinerariifolium]
MCWGGNGTPYGSVVYDLLQKINIVKQGGSLVADYYHRSSNSVKQGFNANIDVKQNEKMSYGNASPGFTSEQIKKLLSLINETPSASIHVNMAVKHLSLMEMSGTGSETSGLYMFDINNKCLVAKSNVVLYFHVSKFLWHNRLGHLADKVLSILKNDLSFSRDTSVPMCEVYHRANQTREPFPLSDRKSKTQGELVHFDLWGPYRVPRREGFKDYC